MVDKMHKFEICITLPRITLGTVENTMLRETIVQYFPKGLLIAYKSVMAESFQSDRLTIMFTAYASAAVDGLVRVSVEKLGEDLRGKFGESTKITIFETVGWGYSIE